MTSAAQSKSFPHGNLAGKSPAGCVSEAMLAGLHILQRDTRRRAILYIAHGHCRRLVQLEEVARTPGQKRAACRADIQREREMVRHYESALGVEAVKSVRSHWGGPGGLEAVAKRIGRGYWRRLYNSLYRYSSFHGHGGDARHHFGYRTREDGAQDAVAFIVPSEAGVREALLTAASLALTLVKRVDERFSIGRATEWDELARQVNARFSPMKRRPLK